jgi:hypothetical protein
MTTAPLAAIEITVRNLMVDYLLKRCKECGEIIIDSSTKPRMFCNNGNVCCNRFSRGRRNRDRSIGFDGRYSGPLNGASKSTLRNKRDAFVFYHSINRNRPLPESHQALHLLLEKHELLKDSVSVVTVRVAPDQVDVNDNRPVVTLPVGVKKPSRATIARIISERKDHLPRPRKMP